MSIPINTIPQGAMQILKTLQENNFQAFLVGGCVRDLLLGFTPIEWDITTSAKPEEVVKLFTKVIPTGIDYGTVTILLSDGQYEVTTYRSDEKYIDGRHPSNVRFTGDIHQDLARRDFTINALAFNPTTGQLIDDHQGQKDLKTKLIRAIGDPIERFSEDGLRSIRACRFAAKLNFLIEPETFKAINKTLSITQKVAPERIHDEILKILSSAKPSIGLDLLTISGIMLLIIPELITCQGVEQPPEFHQFDVYWHSLYACDAAPANNYLVRLAALLHDIAKPTCKVDLTFYNHDKQGEKIACQILQRMRFSKNDIERVTNLISNHMFNYSTDWGDAAVRRFIRRVGLENISDLFLLRQADCTAMSSQIGTTYLSELQGRIDKIIADQNALHIKDLKIDGQDIMHTLNLPPGPKIGQILNSLLEKVLDNPELNTKDSLLRLIKENA
ncbi:MAG: CCA tRNA nucleotidyltransferase [Candidatus Margulisiibacteriota bacterium]